MKWWFSDYDDTIYSTKNNKIDTKDLNFIKKWMDDGNEFIITTGRTFPAAKQILKNMNLKYNYLICNNGATLYDKNDNLLSHVIISFEERKKITDILKTMQGKYMISYHLLDIRKPYSTFPTDEIDPTIFKVCPLINNFIEGENDILNSDLLNDIILFLNKKDTLKFKDFFNSELKSCKAIITNDNIVEIMSNQVSKAFQINFIKEKYNINLEDIYTSGDGENDIEMLNFSLNSFAMSCANENVKKHAKYVINNIYEIENYIKK